MVRNEVRCVALSPSRPLLRQSAHHCSGRFPAHQGLGAQLHTCIAFATVVDTLEAKYKRLRDLMFHGERIDERALPRYEVHKLVTKYFHLYLEDVAHKACRAMAKYEYGTTAKTSNFRWFLFAKMRHPLLAFKLANKVVVVSAGYQGSAAAVAAEANCVS